ncbi:MAG: hypothetical protein M1284_00325 [Candidatus Parvarchaeota archaeon]|jgi:hypothetical protein|nr:hypothetical protein [Candidatus Parvarchaeota archaeon]MCL5420186.1 hypothetical protein [Candidatus Parvarchaeota archaeon]
MLSLEEVIKDFAKSTRSVRYSMYFPYDNTNRYDYAELRYSPKFLITTDPDERKFVFDEKYGLSECVRLRDGLGLFRASEEGKISKNTDYWIYLMQGLGLDPRYILGEYRDNIIKVNDGLYRVQLTKISNGITYFSEMYLSGDGKLEKTRVYQLNGKKFEKFGKNDLDHYLEAKFV